MLKKALISVVVLVIALLGIGFMLPRVAHVERTTVIERPPSLIYATINSFQLFSRWSPWQDLDPAMHQSVDGPREGVGATLHWTGNDKVGTGMQVITASIPNKSVSSDVDFGKMGTAKSVLLLSPDGAKTTVTWTLDADMGRNPIGHYVGLFMDGIVGKDYATGLRKLKALVEGMPDVDLAGFSVDTVELASTPLLIVDATAGSDTPSISKAYADAYAQINKFMAKNKLHPIGPPIGIDGSITPTSYTFRAGIPIDRADVTGAGTVTVTQSYAGKALKATHIGTYDDLGKTYAAYRGYVAAHAYTPAGAIITWYVDDPAHTSPNVLRTEIYWPIK